MPCTMGKAFGDWLKARRTSAGLSLRDLRDASTVSHSQIDWLEKGEREPQRSLILKLAPALGVTASEMLLAACPDWYQGWSREEREAVASWLLTSTSDAPACTAPLPPA